MRRNHDLLLEAAIDRAGGLAPVVVTSGALAAALLVWERWFHTSVLGLDGSWLGSLAYLPLLWLLSAGSILLARPITDRLDVGRRARLVWDAIAICSILGVAFVVVVVVHDLLFAPPQPTSAPGASYLTDEQGLWPAVRHGFGDSLVAQIVLLPIALLAGIGFRDRTNAPLSAASLPTKPTRDPLTGRHTGSTAALLSRREALQFGAAGTIAAAIGSGGLVTLTTEKAHAAAPVDVTPWLSRGVSLFINEGTKKMIDGTPVYMWGWGFESEGVMERDGLHTPGPVIWTHEGETVELRVTNTLNENHSFVINGVVDSGIISPGETVELQFPAPSAGTYLYQDALNLPVNRVLGLHGALLVMPADRTMRSHPALDLQYWEFTSQWVWIFNEIDPAFNAMAQADRTIKPSRFTRDFVPRYFTINGRMGSLAAHVETAPDTVIEDSLDNPALIRMVNAGIATHSPHMHGNHVYVLSTDQQLEHQIMWKDQVMMKPGVTRDIFLPFNIPPNAVYWPPHPDGAAFLKELHGTDMEGKFPMHCHVEQSQTAGGGLYPQGLVTDWKIK